MDNVMVDLETLGTVPGSVILSIGAVAFDEMEVAEEGFYRAIRRETCEQAGLKVSAATLAWWEKQSLEARAVMLDTSATSLEDALRRFNEWLASFLTT
jgi:hypothetical protein